jgi:hypothetical protein
MEKLDFENAFVGAIVYKQDEKKFIYKVNQKSLYIGSKSWEEIKDTQGKLKWTDFMKKVEGEKTSYDGITISSSEAISKDKFIKKNKKQKKYLSQIAEVELRNIYKERVLNENSKTYRMGIEFGKKKCFILEANKQGQFLISMLDGKTYFFYDVITDEYKDLNLKEKKKGIIEWPKKNIEHIIPIAS